MSKINDIDPEEEAFHYDKLSSNNKEEKKYRKELSAKDRSKYKKTDQDQLKKNKASLSKESLASLKRGRVLAITPEGMIVDHEDTEYVCTLKGSLKQEKTLKKNLIAVGDFVKFQAIDETTGVIAEIEPRYSILSRSDNLRKNKEQLIAVNIDQLFIVTSVVMPKLKPSLIDRYIIAAQQGNMTPIIVVNKVDLLKHPPADLDAAALVEEEALYTAFIEAYSRLGIPILEVSALTKTGLEELKLLMKEKASVFSGQSGVGKSTLINHLLGLHLKTADVVSKTYKGAHTTTMAQLIPIDHASFCIDTPGIRSFGIWEMNPEQVQHYFSEFKDVSPHCKYHNCLHLQEPQCAVKEAVEEGVISSMRYHSYVDLVIHPDDAWR
jgi:ribosome biogenesis GTPase